MTQTISKPEIQKAVKPAPRWRNRWFNGWRTDGSMIVGHSWGSRIHQSKDVAETVAARWLSRWANDAPTTKYLGAFPIEGDK